ncbi:MAG: phosphatidylglycerophosphatase A [Candidatus Omnitrophota bacterium]
MQNLTKIIATFFGIGYLPLMPGTYASMSGIVILLLTKDKPYIYFLSIMICIGLGLFFTGKAEKLFNKKDPACVVIDEVAGILLTFIFIKVSVLNIALGFLLFRTFDVIKPLGIKRIQKFKGSLGIMLDDILAAILANFILQVFNLGQNFFKLN